MAEFKVGDVLMYGSVGLVEIIDCRRERALGDNREYYILKEIGSPSDSKIFVPKDSERLVGNMRRLISADKARELLSGKELVAVEWTKDNRARSERFRKIIESGDRVLLLSLISAINKARLERIKEGKKGFILDENTIEKAIRLITAEFSYVLSTPPEKIRQILSNI